MKIPTVEKCCCTTLRTGSLILGWLAIVSAILGIISFIYLIIQINANIDYANYEQREILKAGRIYSIIQLVFAFILLPTAIFLVLGINKAKPKYFLPYLVFSIVCLVYLALSIVIKIIHNYITVADVLASIIGFAINAYFIVVVYSYYKVVEQETTNNGVAYQQPTEAGYPLAAGAGGYNQSGYPVASPGGNNQAGYPLAASPGSKI